MATKPKSCSTKLEQIESCGRVLLCEEGEVLWGLYRIQKGEGKTLNIYNKKRGRFAQCME